MPMPKPSEVLTTFADFTDRDIQLMILVELAALNNREMMPGQPLAQAVIDYRTAIYAQIEADTTTP